MPLDARLEKIRIDSEKKRSGVLYIYDLIDKDFLRYCEVFSIDPCDEDVKDRLYGKLAVLINELKEEHVRVEGMSGGMNAYIKRIGEESSAPKFKLGWATLVCTMSDEGRFKMSREELMNSRRSRYQRSIIEFLMGREAKIVIGEDEIEKYAESRAWPFSSELTQSGKEIVDGYQDAIGGPAVDLIIQNARKSVNGIFG